MHTHLFSPILKNMYFKSKRITFLILGITSILSSRLLFFFFDDPEGPNLLIVMVMAGFIYAVSLFLYTRNSLLQFAGLKRLLVLIFIQVLLVTILYFCLH